MNEEISNIDQDYALEAPVEPQDETPEEYDFDENDPDVVGGFTLTVKFFKDGSFTSKASWVFSEEEEDDDTFVHAMAIMNGMEAVLATDPQHFVNASNAAFFIIGRHEAHEKRMREQEIRVAQEDVDNFNITHFPTLTNNS